ncbi:putative purine permease 11 [Tasmannia lanceolata]|uniref:putative purine permease 11 n=1 Tax=Tasmannia lanceolata TaxID=3420 RepID=UPI004064940E
MDEVPQMQLHVKVEEAQEPTSPNSANNISQSLLPSRGHWQWRILVALSIAFFLSGNSTGTLLGRFYYNKGGNSKWMATLVQSAGFPILLLPLLLSHSSPIPSTTTTTKTPLVTIAFLYVSLGIVMTFDNLMYSYGLLYLPVSTYSLICATQLAFNTLFSFLLNSQKLTPLTLNSVVLLTFSASLLVVHANPADPTSTSSRNHAIGFMCTLGASATYSLLLSLIQLSFQKILKKETLVVVLEMQIYTAAVATFACVVGIFASGEWKSLRGEMGRFEKGRLSYVMTLVWTAVAWQISSIGCLGLIFVVSSLFSTVISTLATPFVPILAVVFFHDKMDGLKVVAMLLALWGFLSFIYQHYLDSSEIKTTKIDVNDSSTST